MIGSNCWPWEIMTRFLLLLLFATSVQRKVVIVDDDMAHVDWAEEIVQGIVPMRALDAVHFASLTTFQAAAGMRVPFVTGDGKQRDAAALLGLEVIWVGQ
jgi:hypothetical protein